MQKVFDDVMIHLNAKARFIAADKFIQRQMLEVLFQSKGAIFDDECLEEKDKPCWCQKIYTLFIVADMKHLKETFAGRCPSKELCQHNIFTTLE